ncbi:phage major capsid protein [Gloeobacter kilaueensis]|uniref:Phage capsid-like C-terminal domain-containing protein n=1 Tax=Gloeobacter kilaueensis (strain ATCC BAA-2537 / CCAP 1431/1 / ULC 316 / JS1) TaxID=1183438 RepID=U5QHN1_GLOK1|nr:phage major capsid protein [Gloeobacter kilaueensis]AGY57139.1 hypothetical protein GKIL_0893 [Gloeobacter kilaueensis JS1]
MPSSNLTRIPAQGKRVFTLQRMKKPMRADELAMLTSEALALDLQEDSPGEIEAQAEESNEYTFSFSSEEPYERWWGTEVLSHAPGAVNLDRLNNGAAFVFNHDPDQFLGCVEAAAVGADRRGYCTTRFSGEEMPQLRRRQVDEGTLRNVSVYYTIDEVMDMGDGLFVVTRWTPIHVTLCSDAADYTVGMGRSLESGETRTIEVKKAESATSDCSRTESLEPTPKTGGISIIANTSKEQIAVAPTDAEERTAEQIEADRVAGIRQLCERFDDGKNGMKGYADILVKLGSTPAEAREAVRLRLEAREQTPIQTFNALGLSEAEQRRYSIARAMLAQMEGRFERDAAFEHECHVELEKVAQKAGIQRRGGVLVPVGDLRSNIASYRPQPGMDLATTMRVEEMRAYMEAQYRAQYAATAGASTGGNLVYTEGMPLIELLRPIAQIMGMGPRIMTGLMSNLQIPRQISGSTGYWVLEDGSITESEATFDNITLTPKTAGAMSAYTRQFLLQATQIPSVEEFIRTDLALGLALTIDKAAINGAGSGGVPLGILNASGVGSVVLGTNGGTIDWPATVSFQTKVANANASALGGLAWLTNPNVMGKLKTTLKAAAAGSDFIWMDGPAGDAGMGMVNGYMAKVSTQVPNNLTKGTGTNLSAAIFGAWSQMLMGFWSIAEFLSDPYKKFDTGGVRVRVFQTVDLAYRHPDAFAVATDIITT